VAQDFADQLRQLMTRQGVTAYALARQVPCDRGLLSRYLSGKQPPSERMAARLDDALQAGGQLAALAGARPAPVPLDDETAALDLARQATASDAGHAIGALEEAVDAAAIDYHRTPPAVLLDRVRGHLGYTFRLLDGRTSLADHRRLLVSAGWLSLLAATCLIDLGRGTAGLAHLRVAAQLGDEARHDEIRGWALETRAWHVLTSGDYRRAVDLSRQAQAVAPPGCSAFIQATAQEGRAWARLGSLPDAYDALGRTEATASRLTQPDQPEHHYRYDPGKSDAYVATTLSWLGDPAAVPYARLVLGRLEDADDAWRRPRRAASARLDLGLALAGTGQLDEAASATLTAVTSGLLVPSNYWRAQEVIAAIDGHSVSEAADLADAYREHCRPG
jgi:transcriptional regulator with XRE-family HTH domain